MNDIMNSLTGLMGGNILISIIIAFIAGIIASFSPCMLSTIPLVVGGVSKNPKNDKKAALKYSLIFSLGVICTFVIIGLLTAAVGRYISAMGNYIYLILGTVLLIFGLQLIGVIGSKDTCKVPRVKSNAFGAFIMGILGGILSSPCSTPILAVILTLVATGGDMVYGVLMLLAYGMGHCILIVIAGTSVGFIEEFSSSSRYYTISNVIKKVIGVVIIAFGLYLVYLGM